MNDKEYTYDIDKYTIGVDENGEDGIGMTVAKVENGEIYFLGNCYGENARCIDLLIKENQELKKQLDKYENPEDMTLFAMWCTEKVKGENERLSEQLELLTSKLDEYDLIVDERNQLKKQLKNMTDNYCNASKLKHERASKIVEMNNQQKKLKEQLENSIKVNMADHKYASECEDKVVVLEAYQKKFTKWLEDEIHTIKTTFSQINGNYGLMNEKLEALKEVLQKYKEIIGVSDESR